MPPNTPIAIVGAGPAGLTLARLLEKASVPYVVFERDHSASWAHESQSSGTLDIQAELGQVALREAGLLEQFQSIARYGVANTIADAHGQVSHVSKEQNGSLSISFQDGSVEAGFRLVIGADGAWSKVRKLITPDMPQYTGTIFFSSYIAPGNLLYSSVVPKAGKGNYLAFGKQQQIFLHYLGDQSYHIAIGLKLSEDSIPDEAVLADPSKLWETLLDKEFVGWTRELTDLVRSGDKQYRSWPLYTMIEDALSWEHVHGVTLVGDAVNLTVPTGDGVNLAMYDSLELARQIIEHGVDDLDSAAIGYEKTMKPRALAAVVKGHWCADNMFGADGPQALLQALGADGSEG